MKQKTFKVSQFNREVEKATKGMTKQAKINVRMTMLLKALKIGKEA